jgi:phosphate transport system protein
MPTSEEHRFERAADQLVVTLRTAHTALNRATAVLFGFEAAVEDGMSAAEQALHELRGEIEELALTAPVGRGARPVDVRVAVADVHIGGDAERIVELTQQIAEIAWARQSKRPLPAHLRSVAEAMSRAALALVAKAGDTMTTMKLEPVAAVEAATGLEHDLDQISAQERLLDRLLVSGEPAVEASDVVDIALLGRCYEGCARHAVSSARHVAMLAA